MTNRTEAVRKMIAGEVITLSEKYGAAMIITEQHIADDYLVVLVGHQMKSSGTTYDRALETERANLGYYAGYYDNKTLERVEQLFRCATQPDAPIGGKL